MVDDRTRPFGGHKRGVPTGRVPRSAFKRGESGNPKGSSARVRQLADIKRLTIEEVAEIGSMVLSNNLPSLMAVRDDPNASVLKIWFAALVVKSMAKGNVQTLDVLLDRIIGKSSTVPYTKAMRDGEDKGDKGCPL